MIFGLAEMQKFAEESDDPRVKAMLKRLRGALSKNSKWCSALAKAERNIADLNMEVERLKTELHNSYDFTKKLNDECQKHYTAKMRYKENNRKLSKECDLLTAKVESLSNFRDKVNKLYDELRKADNTINRERTESDRLVKSLESEIENLQNKVKQLELALSDAIPWIGEPAEGPSWATDEAKAKNRRMCGDALEAACDVLGSTLMPQERKKQ